MEGKPCRKLTHSIGSSGTRLAVGDQTLVVDLARGGLGVHYWMMGHAQHGWWGLIEDVLVMTRAGADVTPGPITDEIEAAAKVMAGQGQDIEELHVDVKAKELDRVKDEGGAILMRFAPTLRGLPDAEAAQVRVWLYSIGERVAETARDEFRGPKVSDREIRALEELQSFLDDPTSTRLVTYVGLGRPWEDTMSPLSDCELECSEPIDRLVSATHTRTVP